jgi:hypothetical protein
MNLSILLIHLQMILFCRYSPILFASQIVDVGIEKNVDSNLLICLLHELLTFSVKEYPIHCRTNDLFRFLPFNSDPCVSRDRRKIFFHRHVLVLRRHVIKIDLGQMPWYFAGNRLFFFIIPNLYKKAWI